MGMIASIFRGDDRDFSNGGVSCWSKKVCITNIEGPFEPNDDCPPVRLERGALNSVRIVPEYIIEEGWPAMFGGCFVHTSDSRFSNAVELILGQRFYGAVALHDRVE